MSRLRDAVAWLQSPRLALAVFAFVCMGAWALFANAGDALETGTRAGLVQGALSAGFVFALAPALAALGAHASGRLAKFAPPLIVCALFLAVLVLGHVVVGARAIAASIAAPALFAIILSALAHWRKRR